MSDTALPQHIDPGQWADRSAELNIDLPLAQMDRLLASARDDRGQVTGQLRFSRDPRGLPRLQGQLSATVALTCQRCLEPVDCALVADVDLYLLGREQQAERLLDEEDYVVCEDNRCHLLELLEDELILALPLVPRHDACAPEIMSALAPAEPETVVEKPRDNPFDVLAVLKQTKH